MSCENVDPSAISRDYIAAKVRSSDQTLFLRKELVMNPANTTVAVASAVFRVSQHFPSRAGCIAIVEELGCLINNTKDRRMVT